MTSTLHYSLSSKTYKNKLFSGFSQLQKQEEFVDLTLAADGCIVKVHRNVIALASPYLREILKTMSGHSPVIYLNNVTKKILSYLLEYIYQGEVNIPVDSVDTFIEVSKSLHIAGIENLEPPKTHLPKLTAKRKKPPERRASNNDSNIKNNSDLEIQQPQINIDQVYRELTKTKPELTKTQPELTNTQQVQNIDSHINNISDKLKNVEVQQTQSLNFDYEYELPSELNAKQVHQELTKPQPESTDTQKGKNISFNENQSDNSTVDLCTNSGFLDHNLLPILTDATLLDQNHSEMRNTPLTEVSTDNITQDQLSDKKKAPGYKIIVTNRTSQVTETPALDNIPVIEIKLNNLGQQDQGMQNQKILPIQTDSLTTNILEDRLMQSTSDQTTNQNNKPIHQIKKPIIKILKDQIIKNLNNSEINFACSQIGPSRSTEVTDIPLGLKADFNDLKNMAQYSFTERGALHLILNRYIYCGHHSSRTKRRWRCIEYRRKACPAFVDTWITDGVLKTRKGIHAHPFHDHQIYKKHKKGLIFNSVAQALAGMKSKETSMKVVTIAETDDEDLV